MKNNYCDLTQEDIHRLPERFKGFLLSPFQHNFSGGFVSVPEDAFKEMIAIIAECASLPPTVEPAQADAPAAPLPEQTGPSAILAKTAHMDDFNQSSVPSYAQFLAWAIWRDNYKEISPDFEIMADTWGALSQIDNMVCGMALKPAASPSPAPAQHPDDIAVDAFAAAMKAKMAKQRDKGYSGWESAACDDSYLANQLFRHAQKGDPVDVGNFAMMLHQRNVGDIDIGKCVLRIAALDFAKRVASMWIPESVETAAPAQVAPLVGFLKSPEGKEAIASWRKRTATPATVKTAEKKPLTRCAASCDGDCTHPECPQLRDNEPHASGRHCPIDTSDEAE